MSYFFIYLGTAIQTVIKNKIVILTKIIPNINFYYQENNLIIVLFLYFIIKKNNFFLKEQGSTTSKSYNHWLYNNYSTATPSLFLLKKKIITIQFILFIIYGI